MDQNGVVTARKLGIATITVSGDVGFYATCNIWIKKSGYTVSSVSQLESVHNYSNNFNNFWVYSLDGAKKIDVTFDERTSVQENSDYIYLYNANGEEVGKYTGKELAGQTITIRGNLVKVKLVSDAEGTDWGFKVTSVTANTIIDEITSDKYEISEDKVLTGLKPGTSVQEMLNNLVGENLTVRKADGTLLEEGKKVGTGCVISMGDGNTENDVTVVVYGDVSGDGEINTSDALKMQMAILNKKALEGVYLQAATAKSHNTQKPTSRDLVAVKQYILKINDSVE